MRSKKGFVFQGLLLLLIVLAGGFLAFQNFDLGVDSQDEHKTFTSCHQMRSFLKKNRESNYYGGFQILGRTQTVAESATKAMGGEAQKTTPDYSKTNIQVEGVDEPDIVKTDGKYLYVVSGEKLFILEAYSANDSKIISETRFDSKPEEIFINEDKLVVFGQDHSYYGHPEPVAREGVETAVASKTMPRDYEQKMFLNVYDISDREDPEISRNISLDGRYYDARMIKNYVYVVADKNIEDYNNPKIPEIHTKEGSRSACNCPDVNYFDVPDSSYKFTTIMSLNLKDDKEKISSDVYLMGRTQNIYVSKKNMYITYTHRIPRSEYREKMIKEVIKPMVSLEARTDISKIMSSNRTTAEKWRDIQGVVEEYFNGLDPEEKKELEEKAQKRMEEFEKEISKEMEKTIIHKISIDEGEIEYKGRGQVPGKVLNQFSMSEKDGYFRIATTTGDWRAENYNHVYVLNKDLEIVGKVEDLAKGETIRSARFVGDRCYLVTFERIDPLFVIDLENPEDPKVLGELKITGYSGYLHPYDEDHLIGIGKETEETKWGVRETGVKLALFDVSDVENPKQEDSFVIEGDWAHTEVMNDHKAFLFDKEKELLAIPVSVNKEVMDTYMRTQGAYVFNINLEEGFDLKGIVEHEKKEVDRGYYYRDSYVKRSLYIGDVLYTISDSLVKMNNLEDLEELNQIELE